MNNLKNLLKIALITSPVLIMASCNSNKAKYEDLSNGEKVYIVKDKDTGMAMDSLTNKPVYFYVDLDTKDTISGETGEVVNNKIIKTAEGKYEMAKSDLQQQIDEMKEDPSVKIKTDGNGDMKIKTDDKKIKIEDGDVKIKDK